jgi:hypothetical protein
LHGGAQAALVTSPMKSSGVPRRANDSEPIVKLSLGIISANWNLSQICWTGGDCSVARRHLEPWFWRKPFFPSTTQKKAQREAAFLRDSPRCARKERSESTRAPMTASTYVRTPQSLFGNNHGLADQRYNLNRNPEPVRGSTTKGANPPSAWDQP